MSLARNQWCKFLNGQKFTPAVLPVREQTVLHQVVSPADVLRIEEEQTVLRARWLAFHRLRLGPAVVVPALRLRKRSRPAAIRDQQPCRPSALVASLRGILPRVRVHSLTQVVRGEPRREILLHPEWLRR